VAAARPSGVDGVDRRVQHLRLTPTGDSVPERLSALHRDELRRSSDEMTDLLHERGE
jgi:hypothetical protein